MAWIPGLSCYDIGAGVSQTRLVGMTNVSTALFANVFGAAIALTIDSDLSMHGGEDAVLTRIVGRLGFTTGRVDSGAGAAATTFVARVVVAQTDFIPASGSVMPFEFLTSSGMGQDDILYMRDVIIPGTSVLEAAGASVPLHVQRLRVGHRHQGKAQAAERSPGGHLVPDRLQRCDGDLSGFPHVGRPSHAAHAAPINVS